MPKIPKKCPIDPFIEDAINEIAEFENGFESSQSNPDNLWRDWNGKRVTIFLNEDDETCSWCIADDEEDELRFSPRRFLDQDDALSSLCTELGVGGIR